MCPAAPRGLPHLGGDGLSAARPAACTSDAGARMADSAAATLARSMRWWLRSSTRIPCRDALPARRGAGAGPGPRGGAAVSCTSTRPAKPRPPSPPETTALLSLTAAPKALAAPSAHVAGMPVEAPLLQQPAMLLPESAAVQDSGSPLTSSVRPENDRSLARVGSEEWDAGRSEIGGPYSTSSTCSTTTVPAAPTAS